MQRLARRVVDKAELQKWLRKEIQGDAPPRRVKKKPEYKYPELIEKLEHGVAGSREFWDNFPVNPDVKGPGPYEIDSDRLMSLAVQLDYPNLRLVEDVCGELINGVDQGVDWKNYQHTRSENNPSVISAEWEPSIGTMRWPRPWPRSSSTGCKNIYLQWMRWPTGSGGG